jgi:hypothetical protein
MMLAEGFELTPHPYDSIEFLNPTIVSYPAGYPTWWRILFDGVGRRWTRDGAHSNSRNLCISVLLFYCVELKASNESSRTRSGQW